MPEVPVGNILEQIEVCSKELVHPGPQILVVTEHDPRSAISCLYLMTRKELNYHVLKTLHQHSLCGGLVAFLSIWVRHIRVKVTGDENIRDPGALAYGHHYVLHSGGFVQHKIASDDVPSPPSCHHLEYDLTTFGPCR